ncbi:MAG: sensor histidine kinase [Rubrimonas sp.]
MEADRRRPSVRRQLATMLALAIMPAFALAVADGVRTYNAELSQIREAFMRDAIVQAERQRDTMVGVKSAMAAIAAAPIARAWASADCDALLAAQVESFPGWRYAMALDRDGEVRCASDPATRGMRFGDDPRFDLVDARDGFGVIMVERGAITGMRALVASSPLRADGERIGTLVVSIDPAAIAVHGVEARQAIVDDRGAPLSAFAPSPENVEWLPALPELQASLGWGPAVFAADSRDGRHMIYAASPLLQNEAWLITAANAAEARRTALISSAAPVLSPFLMLLIAVAVGYFALDRLVVQHLDYITRFARVYGRGRLDLRPRIGDSAPREVAALSAVLGDMAQQLAARQDELKQSAEANRLLLLEVYHRVKNNLQMIVSLLNLQRRNARSHAEREALARIQARVHSLALVHERLYAANNLSTLDFAAVAGEFATYLAGLDGQGVTVKTDFEPVELTADRATPAIMFLNEALTNALKYANAPDGRAEALLILRPRDDGGFTLTIRNHAAASPPEGDDRPEAVGSLGSDLMRAFARQMGATLETVRENGVYSVTLNAPPQTMRSVQPASL